MYSKQALSGGGFIQVLSVGSERCFNVGLCCMDVSIDSETVNGTIKFYCHNFGRIVTQR